MFCPNCGAETVEDVSFCGKCGSKISMEQATTEPSEHQPSETDDSQRAELPHLEPIAALRQIFAKRGNGSKCVSPLSQEVWQDSTSIKVKAVLPPEKPLALFGTVKSGKIFGILVTDTYVRWRICAIGSHTKWREGKVEHSKISSIGFVSLEDEGDDLLVVNDNPVGVFFTGRSIIDGESKKDEDALSAAKEFCELVTIRAPKVNQCSHPVEWMFNGRVGEQLPVAKFSYAVAGLCMLLYVIQWLTGSFDSDAKFNKVAESLGSGIPIWGYLVCGLMHGGIVHLVANILGLLTFCASVEKIFGIRLFAVTYLTSVVGGGVFANVIHPDVLTVGASGGIFGIMGAVFVFGGIRFSLIKGRLSGVDRHRVNRWVRGNGALLLGNLYFTFKFAKLASISVGGHLGGLLVGFVFGIVALLLVPSRREFLDVQ